MTIPVATERPDTPTAAHIPSTRPAAHTDECPVCHGKLVARIRGQWCPRCRGWLDGTELWQGRPW